MAVAKKTAEKIYNTHVQYPHLNNMELAEITGYSTTTITNALQGKRVQPVQRSKRSKRGNYHMIAKPEKNAEQMWKESGVRF